MSETSQAKQVDGGLHASQCLSNGPQNSPLLVVVFVLVGVPLGRVVGVVDWFRLIG